MAMDKRVSFLVGFSVLGLLLLAVVPVALRSLDESVEEVAGARSVAPDGERYVARAGANIVALGDADFDDIVQRSEQPVVVYFWAEWCGPCKMMKENYERFAARSPEALVAKVNVDDNPNLTRRFGISAIPTILIIDGGRVVAEEQGVLSNIELQQLLADVARGDTV